MSEIWFLLFEGIFGIPAVLLLGRLLIRTYKISSPLLIVYRGKTILALTLVFICSLGVFGYISVFIIEFYELFNCRGAGCAQAGLGTFVFTPIAWLSLALAWAVVRGIFTPKYFPTLVKIDLQTRNTQ